MTYLPLLMTQLLFVRTLTFTLIQTLGRVAVPNAFPINCIVVFNIAARSF